MTATTATRESLLDAAAARRDAGQLPYFGALTPQETAALLAPKLGIEQPVVETWLRRVPYGVTPVTPQIVASQQQIADLFLQQKLIPKPVNVQSAVWQANFPVAGL